MPGSGRFDCLQIMDSNFLKMSRSTMGKSRCNLGHKIEDSGQLRKNESEERGQAPNHTVLFIPNGAERTGLSRNRNVSVLDCHNDLPSVIFHSKSRTFDGK